MVTKNPFERKMTSATKWQIGMTWFFRLCTYFILGCAAYIFLDIGIKGGREVFQLAPPFINVPFLTERPETLHVFDYEGQELKLGAADYQVFLEENDESRIQNEHTYVYCSGGIFPAIVGTVLLVTGSVVIALFLGVISAIFLSEYSKRGPFIQAIRLAIINLAGVPSIVFGIFGAAMFVNFLDWNISLMAGWFTLAFMVLPIVITASEESLRAVPHGFREGSLALGATQWQTIRTNVLPYALPGILTSSVLGITRVAGETAPIMFTAAYVVRDELPWEVAKLSDFFFQGVMALPYHIYVVAAKVPQNEYTSKVQYATCFVFLIIVFLIALTSIILRMKVREKIKW
ncbi:MAG: phosphate ABC transporter permease PstA [Verrucomicrobiota bacterium]